MPHQASLAVQCGRQRARASPSLSLTRPGPLAVARCPWSLPPPQLHTQVALSSSGQRKVGARGSSRSACRRITTSRTSLSNAYQARQPPLRALAQHPATLIDRSHLQDPHSPVCARRWSSSHPLSHCYYHQQILSRIVANHSSTVTASTRPRATSICSPSQTTLWPLWTRRPRPAHPSHLSHPTQAYRKRPQTASRRNRRTALRMRQAA